MIKKYRKKPVVIEAMLYTIKHYRDLKDWAGDNVTMQLNSETAYQVIDNTAYPIISPIIHTLEGDMKVDNGDYVIKGVNGEFYPCKPDIFDKTYEEVENEI